MSRHRNMKQLIADDDYYDDYYYDDGYDDYDDYGGGPVAAPKKNNNKANNNKKGGVATTKKTTTPKKQPAAAARKTTPQPKSQTPTKASAAATSSKQTTSLSVVPAVSASSSSSVPTLPPPPGFTSAAAPPPPLPPTVRQRLAQRPTRTCIVLGHVDAGKSTLTGHLLWAAAGGKSATVNRKGSHAKAINFAWLLDEDEQEREHGVTMDVGTKTLECPHHRVILQDAPGHADYVPHTIAGVALADTALAVVDVTDLETAVGGGGGSHKPNYHTNNSSAGAGGQLREHVSLAAGLGIARLIVVLNKMDLLAWSRDAFETVQTQLEYQVLPQLGYNSAVHRIQFIPVSALVGTFVYRRMTKNNPDAAWYQGPTVAEALDELVPTDNNKPQGGVNSNNNSPVSSSIQLAEQPLRTIVIDVTTEHSGKGGGGGGGIAVRLRIATGWLQRGDTLTLLPVRDNVTVHKVARVQEGISTGGKNNNNLPTTTTTTASTITLADDNQYAAAGDMVDVVLRGTEISRISTGNVLGRPNNLPSLSQRCICKVYILDVAGASSIRRLPIIQGTSAVMYLHSIQVPCHLVKLVRSRPPNGTGWKDRPRSLPPKSQAVVEIQLQIPVALEHYDKCRILGRFVLRRDGMSIAVGRVEEVTPLPNQMGV